MPLQPGQDLSARRCVFLRRNPRQGTPPTFYQYGFQLWVKPHQRSNVEVIAPALAHSSTPLLLARVIDSVLKQPVPLLIFAHQIVLCQRRHNPFSPVR